MTNPDVMNQTLRLLTLEEVGYCRLFVSVTLADEEAAAWLRCLDAWDAFLRLDASSPVH